MSLDISNPRRAWNMRTKSFQFGKTEAIRVAICFWLSPGSGRFCRGNLALKCNFGLKFYKPLQVWGFICRHSRHWSVFVVQGTTNIKGELFFFAIKRKVPLIPLKEKNASDICSSFSLFSLHEMSLDISNPCGNSPAIPAFKMQTLV